MSKELQKVGVKTEYAEVVKHGDKIMIPENMSLESAIDVLLKRAEYSESKMAMTEEFDVFPWDGAVALQTVMCKRFGYASATTSTIQTMFGPMEKPPTTLMVEVAYGKKVPVIWGAFSLPGIPVKMQCSAQVGQGGRVKFIIQGEFKRKYEDQVRGLLDDVRRELKENSIYKGKALRIRFKNEAGEPFPIPEVSFLDVNSVSEDRLILSDDIYASVDTNLFTPIRRVRELAANNLPVKRGVLFGGTYGTGKTLSAAVASKLATQAGVLYLAVDRADELSQAIEFAKQYQDPACVIFCEDVDRVTDGERDVEMDDLLNIIDGIDSKSFNMIIVLTTNELEEINPAMLRPGRLDAVIKFETPDAKAIERLLRYYGKDCISDEESLTAVGKVLQGCIPAVVEEVVKRAKLAQLKMNPVGHLVESISAAALLESAKTMQGQLDLLEKKMKEVQPTDKSFTNMVQDAVQAVLRNGGGEAIADAVARRM